MGTHAVIYPPIQDVESPVAAQQRHIVAGQVVNVLRPLQQDELRQDRHCLQVYRECPEDLQAQ